MILSPDEEVIHDQNKRIELLKQKVHVLNEANMKLENMIGKLYEQLQEANEVIESLRTYDFTVDDENAERYQVKWNVDAKRSYERSVK